MKKFNPNMVLLVTQYFLLFLILILVMALPFMSTYFMAFKSIASIVFAMILSYFLNNV